MLSSKEQPSCGRPAIPPRPEGRGLSRKILMKIAVSVLHSGHTSISGSDAGLRYPGDCIAIVALVLGVMRHSSILGWRIGS